MKYACEAAQNHIIRSPYRGSNIARFYSLSPKATTEAVDLLTHLLKFDPVSRALELGFGGEGGGEGSMLGGGP